MQHKESINPERNRGDYFNGIELDRTKLLKMSASMEKTTIPDIILTRENYEEWNQSIRRKLNEVPMMVDWIQGNQDAEMDFSVIPFEQIIKGKVEVRYQPTGRMVADIGTKAVTSTALERHMDTINMVKLKPTIN